VPPFVQMVEPLGSVLAGTLVAMIPVVVLLVLLAGLRFSALPAVIVGAVVTLTLAVIVWEAHPRRAWRPTGSAC